MEPVPVAEILTRQATFQELLAAAGIDLALIRQTADLYYYSGIIVDGFLALSPNSEPLLLVRRPQHRVQELELPFPMALYRDIKDLPAILSQLGLGHYGAIGVELDVMPAALYRRFQEKLFPQRPLLDLSNLIRRQRMVKSPYEIAQIRRAAHILDDALVGAAALIKTGLTELELAAELEYRLRLAGHQGLVRTRTWNLEMFFGHVLSGAAGAQAAYVDTPSGGTGFSHGFPQGAGTKPLAPGEPISVDIAACVNGYIADETRMYVIGDLPDTAWQALDLVAKLFPDVRGRSPARRHARRPLSTPPGGSQCGRPAGPVHGPRPGPGGLFRPRRRPGTGRVPHPRPQVPLPPGRGHGHRL